MATLKLISLAFRAGAGPESPPLSVQPGSVTILVGPNNSGKSLALREVEAWCWGRNEDRKVVEALEADFGSDPEASEELIRGFQTDPPQGRASTPESIWIGLHTFRADQPVLHMQVNLQQLRGAVGATDTSLLRAMLLGPHTVRLDGRTRFSLADDKPTGDLQSHPQNHLWALFRDDAARDEVRRLTAEAFDLHFTIDPTSMQSFRIRMADRPPTSRAEEQALDQAARDFHAEATPINQLSDGVQAFVGLVSAVLSLPHRVILVDEPEAFLHPALARRLGANLTRLSHSRAASLIVSTHSADFLMGCIETADDASVVRLTFEAGSATARALDAMDLRTLFRDPLLRSTQAIQALFHRAAVVTESEADRAFYDEMNRRLQGVDRGIRDAIFLHAQNLQTIHRLVRPLRQVGIPAGAVADLDFLNSGAVTIERLMGACQIPAHLQPELVSRMDQTLHALQTQSPTAIKRGGVNSLPEPARTHGMELLDALAAYGLFIVPSGELESFLAPLSAPGHGPDWLVEVFSRIGQSEDDSDYLAPSADDVWAFIDRIRAWVETPARLGTDPF